MAPSPAQAVSSSTWPGGGGAAPGAGRRDTVPLTWAVAVSMRTARGGSSSVERRAKIVSPPERVAATITFLRLVMRADRPLSMSTRNSGARPPQSVLTMRAELSPVKTTACSIAPLPTLSA